MVANCNAAAPAILAARAAAGSSLKSSDSRWKGSVMSGILVPFAAHLLSKVVAASVIKRSKRWTCFDDMTAELKKLQECWDWGLGKEPGQWQTCFW